MNRLDAKADAIGHVTMAVRVAARVLAAVVMEDAHLTVRILVQVAA